MQQQIAATETHKSDLILKLFSVWKIWSVSVFFFHLPEGAKQSLATGCLDSAALQHGLCLKTVE